MNKLDEPAILSTFSLAEQRENFSHQTNQENPKALADPEQQESTLRAEAEKALRRYFQHLDDEPVSDLYQMVMSEVELPLLQAVMRHTGNNQSKASVMLGLNRGTLRSKLKNHGML